MKSLLFICLLIFQSRLATAQVSKAELNEIIEAFDQTFKTQLHARGEDLVINDPLPLPNWDWYETAIPNASYVQDERDGIKIHSLTIMGGLLKTNGVTQDTAVLILCHELGHGIGGAPFKNENAFTEYQTSTEAQADYYSTYICAPQVWQHLHPEK